MIIELVQVLNELRFITQNSISTNRWKKSKTKIPSIARYKLMTNRTCNQACKYVYKHLPSSLSDMPANMSLLWAHGVSPALPFLFLQDLKRQHLSCLVREDLLWNVVEHDAQLNLFLRTTGVWNLDDKSTGLSLGTLIFKLCETPPKYFKRLQ